MISGWQGGIMIAKKGAKDFPLESSPKMRAPEIKLKGDGQRDEVTARRRGMRLVCGDPSPRRKGFTIEVCEKMFSTGDVLRRETPTLSDVKELDVVTEKDREVSPPVIDDGEMKESSEEGRIAIAIAALVTA